MKWGKWYFSLSFSWLQPCSLLRLLLPFTHERPLRIHCFSANRQCKHVICNRLQTTIHFTWYSPPTSSDERKDSGKQSQLYWLYRTKLTGHWVCLALIVSVHAFMKQLSCSLCRPCSATVQSLHCHFLYIFAILVWSFLVVLSLLTLCSLEFSFVHVFFFVL